MRFRRRFFCVRFAILQDIFWANIQSMYNLFQCKMVPNNSYLCKIMVKIMHHTLHTEKSFWNRVKSNWNQIVFIIFWLIWNQMKFCLVPNQSENDIYSLISVWFDKIPKKNISVCKWCPANFWIGTKKKLDFRYLPN